MIVLQYTNIQIPMCYILALDKHTYIHTYICGYMYSLAVQTGMDIGALWSYAATFIPLEANWRVFLVKPTSGKLGTCTD